MEQQEKNPRRREVSIGDILRKLRKGKKYFFITLPLAFILTCVVILPVPRYYQCVVKLAPESSTPNVGGLGSLASTMGLNIGNMPTQDAIIPKMYPDMMSSTDFQVSLFPVKVAKKDGSLSTTYYKYLKDHQRHAWWQNAFHWLLHKLAGDDEGGGKANAEWNVNPFNMTKDQSDVAKAIGGKIRCVVDKRTNVIAISVTDQDPLVCAMIADTARSRLQQFIIDYRTKKARIDLEHVTRLAADAKRQYLVAQEKYAAFCDANEDLVLESFKLKRDELENEMQLKFNNYQLQTNQMEMAKAKLQERTPAFTVIQNASVPTKPAGPKRMFTVLAVLLITFFVTAIYVIRKKTDSPNKSADESGAQSADSEQSQADDNDSEKTEA